jgi:hypothetical protein
MEQRMPLARYFSWVGGALLALLFVLDELLPKPPVARRAETHLPAIRIHTDRKWPERIVFDTSVPTPIPNQIASNEVGVPVPEAIAELPFKAREREAFAMLQSSSVALLHPTGTKKRDPKLQRKHKIAARRNMMRTVWAARQPPFGWFGRSIW